MLMRHLVIVLNVVALSVCTPLMLDCIGQPPSVISPPKVELPIANPPYYRVRYAPSEQAGELPYGVSYTIWIPPEVAKVRGVIVHQHGCGEGACRAGQTAAFDLHWQALARKHQCALLGPSYEQPEQGDCQLWCDPRHGSGARFLQALDELAGLSGHPELNQVPWALWGHSGGGTWVGTMVMLYPQRVACVWLRSGSPRLTPRDDGQLPTLAVPAAALQVPMMCNLGTKEGVTEKDNRFARVWDNTQTFFKTLRQQGALIGVSVDPHSSHDCGNQRYLAIRWIDACLAARLPDGNDLRTSLHAIDQSPAWLAELLSDQAVPAADFSGSVAQSIWLPNAEVARLWAEYSQEAGVSDSTPPPAPTNVQVQDKTITWQATADLESGLAAFIIQRDGVEIGRVPEKNQSPFGRPIFQRNSYSDTPSQPLSQMTYTDDSPTGDTTPQPNGARRYSVIAVNTVGLQSEPAHTP